MFFRKLAILSAFALSCMTISINAFAYNANDAEKNSSQEKKNTATNNHSYYKYYNPGSNENNDISEEIADNYSIYVNKYYNTVTVCRIDNSGYEIPYKSFVCSVGRPGHDTPEGEFKTSDYYEWRLMVDGSYGRYAVRFNNHILFHSVPYLKASPDSLEWDQFNLLGQSASLGCVRLSTSDCKWIYDNCKVGTKVTVFSDSTTPGPLGKPTSIKIPANAKYKTWDPTDPGINNPWTRIGKSNVLSGSCGAHYGLKYYSELTL